MPKKPTEKLEVHTLFTEYDDTLENAQNEKEEY
jgi:hypothetical protein